LRLDATYKKTVFNDDECQLVLTLPVSKLTLDDMGDIRKLQGRGVTILISPQQFAMFEEPEAEPEECNVYSDDEGKKYYTLECEIESDSGPEYGVFTCLPDVDEPQQISEETYPTRKLAEEALAEMAEENGWCIAPVNEEVAA